MRPYYPFAVSTQYFNNWRTFVARAKESKEAERYIWCGWAVIAQANYVMNVALELQKQENKTYDNPHSD